MRDDHQTWDPVERLLRLPVNTVGYHSRLGGWAHHTRESLDYVLTLLSRPGLEWRERAWATLTRVLELQDQDPASPTCGVWPWYLEEPLAQMRPPDLNWADFLGHNLVELLHLPEDRLSPPLRAAVARALRLACEAIRRRDVGPAYTNICLMGAGVTLLGGELLGDPGLAAYGRDRLARFAAYTDQQGSFNEYNSPTYTTVAIEELSRILVHGRDPAAGADARRMHRQAWEMVAEHWHPATRQWAGPHGRAYSELTSAFESRLISGGTGLPLIAAPPARVPCPADLHARFRALPAAETEIRRRFILADDPGRSTWGHTWMDGCACLGSASRECTWTQRHPLIAYWTVPGGVPACLRLRLLRQGKDFASGALWTAQRGRRVLALAGLAEGLGDHHIFLDRPADGVFDLGDLRLRIQLRGTNPRLESLGADRWSLACGDARAVIHAPPGRLGGRPVAWRPGGEDGCVWIDAIANQDRPWRTRLADCGSHDLALGVEILSPDQDPGTQAIVRQAAGGGRLLASWLDGLAVEGPTGVEAWG